MTSQTGSSIWLSADQQAGHRLAGSLTGARHDKHKAGVMKSTTPRQTLAGIRASMPIT
jgi:hypothetical protein